MHYVLIIDRDIDLGVDDDDGLAHLSVHKTLRAAEGALLCYVENYVDANLAAAPGPDVVEGLAEYGERVRIYECRSAEFVRRVTPFEHAEAELEEVD
jgi:hypothetical protein